jgi:hypothetical protein
MVPEVDIPGDLRLAGFSGRVPGEPGRIWVRAIRPEKPYFYSNNDRPKNEDVIISLRLLDLQGEELWREEGRCPQSPWREVILPWQKLSAGSYDLEAILIYDELPMARMSKPITILASEQRAEVISAPALGEGDAGNCEDLVESLCGSKYLRELPPREALRIPVTAAQKEGLLAFYGTFRVPTGIFQAGINDDLVPQEIHDPELLAQEVFLGFGRMGDLLTIQAGEQPLAILRVRHELLTAADEALAGHDTPKNRDRRVVVNNDGFSEGFFEPDWNPKQLAEQILRFRGRGVTQVDMCSLVSDTASYPSAWVDFYGEDPDLEWPGEGYRGARRHYEWLATETEGLFPQVVKAGRSIGLTVGGSLRMNVSYGHHPFGRVMNGKLWFDRPDLRLKRSPEEEDDNENSLSFAYPETRARRIGVLREMAEFGCQEVNLDFCRYPRVMGYDGPLLEEFSRRHGTDGSAVEIDDPRWICIRQEVMTGFLRDLRQTLGEVRPDSADKVRISIRLPATNYEGFGFDPAVWAAEGLVDVLIPAFPGHDRWCDVAPWVAMTRNTPTQILAGIEYFRHQTSESELTDAEMAQGIEPGRRLANFREDFLRRAAEAYAKGADGMYVFNVWDNSALLAGLEDAAYVRHWSRFLDRQNLDTEVHPSRLVTG